MAGMRQDRDMQQPRDFSLYGALTWVRAAAVQRVSRPPRASGGQDDPPGAT